MPGVNKGISKGLIVGKISARPFVRALSISCTRTDSIPAILGRDGTHQGPWKVVLHSLWNRARDLPELVCSIEFMGRAM